jgi:exosome complex component RRP4
MTELKVKDREICAPGETAAVGMDYIPGRGVYRDGDILRAGRLGMVSIEGKVIKLIPLSGKYIPKLNDKIIGKVIDVLMTGWRMDINSPYSSVLTLKDASSEFISRGADLTQYYDLGDYVMCKITQVTSQKLIDVTMRGPGLRKLKGGSIISANAFKVPRIIGKDGSMVSMIKEATGCNILVGQNGLIWIDGAPEMEVIAVDAMKMIEDQAHLGGLTDRIKAFLEKKTNRKVLPTPAGGDENGTGV